MHETNQNKPRITCHGRIDLGDNCVRVSMGEKQRDSLVASVFPPYLYLGAQGAQGLVSAVVGTNVTRENGKASSKWEENTQCVWEHIMSKSVLGFSCTLQLTTDRA